LATSSRATVFARSTRALLRPVEILIAAGADVNQRGQGGYMPLGIARRFGRPDVEARLIAAGAIAEAPEKAEKKAVKR
jgi:hypothetical protein